MLVVLDVNSIPQQLMNDITISEKYIYDSFQDSDMKIRLEIMRSSDK